MTEKLIPDLSGVIKPQDVSEKGTGNYKAEYVNWARVAHILHQHAPGWQFHLVPDANGGFVHKAPNGTGFVMGHFVSPEGHPTADFYQSVMDNRNAPVPYEKISARDFTDTHRRALAAAAAFTFGLAWELWAKEKIEDPHQREAVQPAPAQPAKTKAPDTISELQLKRLFTLASKANVSNEQAKAIINNHGFESSKDITRDKYEAICAAIQGGSN